MENGETTHDGAVRETLEEANARVDVASLFTLFNLPHADQVFMIYRGQLLDLDFSPGEESLDVRLFSEDEIPWGELAFPTVRELLREYLEDRKTGQYPVRNTVIEYPRR